MSTIPKLIKYISLCFVIVFTLLMTGSASAQSTELNYPSPIHSSDVVGKIAARDLGDARLTDHFYVFTGTPGDVIITVQGTNLNGDVDVFTSTTLRPLLKFALYAESPAPITKSIYLRRREDLIVRIQARSPNDDEGTYQLRFSGSFEPMPGVAESPSDTPGSESAAQGSGKKTRRVSSSGARIDEPVAPVAEVAAAPTPEPTPAESPSSDTAKDKIAEADTQKPVTPKSTPPRNARGRRPASRRTPASPKSEKTTTVGAPTATEPAEVSTTATTTATTPTEPTAEPAAPRGPRLVIETKGGTLINRPMSSVRRVTVENGLVFVVGKDGRTLQLQLVNIVKMAIEP